MNGNKKCKRPWNKFLKNLNCENFNLMQKFTFVNNIEMLSYQVKENVLSFKCMHCFSLKYFFTTPTIEFHAEISIKYVKSKYILVWYVLDFE